MRRVLALCWLLVAIAACARHQVDLSQQAPATSHEEPGGFEEATVIRAIDGDTLEVTITAHHDGPGAGAGEAGRNYDVRLIGIDTPESVTPGTPVECFAREASAALSAVVGGADVVLMKDVEESDRYGRLLRYVYLGDEMVNARLVVNGYAHAYTYPPNVRHADLFVRLQREARVNDRGLWSPDTCNGEQ
ncbi:MAG: thermonuclease family protein [Actinomycetota bacterium]|nr:thermonuclease family protein [Actinomycetota bacterium]